MNAKVTTSSPRYQALIQLLRAADTIWNGSRVFFAQWDLSPSQFNILNVLHGQPDGLSQTVLSEELLMHRSNVTGLVDRLEARGLVQRRDTPADRRAYRVVLTTAGNQLMNEILPHYYEAAEKLWGNLTTSRVNLLVTDLGKVIANAERTAMDLNQKPNSR